MRLRCDQCREQLLDHLYGLLDPAEVAALDEHLAACPACAVARAEAGRLQGLLAQAAKPVETDIRFVAPTEPAIEPARKAEEPRHTVGRAWVTWAVAASLFLMTAGLAGPMTRDSLGFLVYKPRVTREVATVLDAKQERDRTYAALRTAEDQIRERVAALEKKHDEVREQWTKAAEVAVALPRTRPFAVTVKGPGSAIPGAPNEYTLGVSDSKKPRDVAFEAVVKDAAGKTLFSHKLDPKDRATTPEQTVRLPAAMWDGLTPGSELFLHVTATDTASQESATLTEAIRLLEPVYTTLLTTDKPMYRPGETLYFRSLTLDRTRFLPPTRDLNLRFELKKATGEPVALPPVGGLATPITATRVGEQQFVVGPDGQPVRGVGTGAFVLPTSLTGGEYMLVVTEAVPNAKPLATRKVLINDYTPHKLEKKVEFDATTYGPGDTVQAKIEVRDQGKPVANARLTVTILADNKKVTPDVPATGTDAAGNAAVRFTLPKDDVPSAVIVVEVDHRGLKESLLQPIPVASRKLNIEFFPEGGDLVAGLPSRVYFRATTNTGKPADVSGVLTDGRNTICDIKTLTDPDRPGVNQGLGVFEFTPQAGTRYAVRLNRPIGTQQLATPFAAMTGVAAAQPLPAFQLPPVKTTGVVMAVKTGVTRMGETIQVQLRSDKKRNVLVGAYTRGRPVASRKATLEAGKATDLSLDFGDTKLGGVTRITVFEVPEAIDAGSTELTPLAERLVFRQPSEALKLTVTPTTSGAFTPGSSVQLHVAATDEAGNPTPAILWAAVVNNSVVTMANEKTTRSLPTHFLLGGDVQKAEDLEHADFLLTDHPQAKTALDLVLGTQGWRRFAETSMFQKLTPSADRDRLTASLTGGELVARSDVRRVFDEYWPRYSAAVFDLEQAEADQKSGKSAAGPRDEASKAELSYQGKLTALGEAASDLEVFDKSMEDRRAVLPVTVFFVFTLAGICLLAMVTRRRGAAERRPLAAGAVGFVLLGVFILTTVGLTSLGGDQWRSVAAGAPRRDPWGNWQGGSKSINIRPDGMAFENGMAPMPPVAVRGQKPGVMDKGGRANTPGLPPYEAKVTLRPLPTVFVREPQATQRLDKEYSKRRAAGKNADAGFQQVRDSAPRTMPLVVREYAHVHSAGPSDGTRSDFTETVFWHPVLVLPQDGQAMLKFDLSDSVNAYQVLVAGHTLDGRLGSVTSLIEVHKPIVVDAKLPHEIGAADKLDVPVMVTNNTPYLQRADVTLVLNDLKADGETAAFKLDLAANGGGRQLVRLTPTTTEGPATIRAFGVVDPTLSDAVMRSVNVVPDGFPMMGATSDILEVRARFPITIPPQWNKGSMRATVTVYPNTLAEVQAGLAGLLREPSGCFEQSSTANYPNVLVLDYLRETNQADPDASRRARELLDRGYSRLTTYECPKTGAATRIGYEWFGAADRPHEALTAYGLLQFTDMARVFPVDPEMLKRTKQFLLDSRDGNGGFKRNARALDQFGRAPTHVTNAYIVWALTEAERGESTSSDLTKELNALVVLAKDGDPAKDPYFLALVGNALLNRGRQADGVALLKMVAAMQTKDGRVTGAATSITASSGRSLDIETTAFALLGWLKVNRPETFAEPTQAAMKWIAAQRDGYGAFGASQSTILALKALLEYARLNKKPAESGTLRVFVGAVEVAKREFTTAAPGPIVIEIPNADETFKPGPTEIRVETTAKQPYPVSVAWSCRTRQPASSANCAVKLTTKLDAVEVAEGAPVQLDVVLENLTDRGQGMAVAVIGLPAGLKLPEDAKELKALCDSPADGEATVSYWELRGRELVLYWRGLAPKQRIALKLSLIAYVPGEFRGPASRAYLYYDPDHKHWVEPTDLRVMAKAGPK